VDSDLQGSAGQRPKVNGVVSGVVTDVLPSAMYRVKLDEGGHIVQAHIADRVDRNFVRVLVGDRVRVELTADVGRGRIVRRI
jgi:translation initiation factor IF-1